MSRSHAPFERRRPREIDREHFVEWLIGFSLGGGAVAVVMVNQLPEILAVLAAAATVVFWVWLTMWRPRRTRVNLQADGLEVVNVWTRHRISLDSAPVVVVVDGRLQDMCGFQAGDRVVIAEAIDDVCPRSLARGEL